MADPSLRRRRWLLPGLLGLIVVLGAALAVFWGDLVSTALDPKVPFQTYDPPPPPDYARSSSWYLRPHENSALEADVFFVAPTTYDGGRNWNARLAARKANRQFEEVMAPNYVGPFVTVGRVFAPRYRQASLYSLTTLREDAREARQFAYGDVRDAFRWYIDQDNGGRPFILVGVSRAARWRCGCWPGGGPRPRAEGPDGRRLSDRHRRARRRPARRALRRAGAGAMHGGLDVGL